MGAETSFCRLDRACEMKNVDQGNLLKTPRHNRANSNLSHVAQCSEGSFSQELDIYHRTPIYPCSSPPSSSHNVLHRARGNAYQAQEADRKPAEHRGYEQGGALPRSCEHTTHRAVQHTKMRALCRA